MTLAGDALRHREIGRNRRKKQGIAKRMIKNAIVLEHDGFAARTDRCEPRPEHSPSFAGSIDLPWRISEVFWMIR
jgi:hypothetical protein